MSTLQGQVIIVTGAGRGLGRAYALDLARRGARIIVNTRPRAATAAGSAEAVVDEIHALGGQAIAMPLAVEEADSGERLLNAALDAFGRLDGLLNNAIAPYAATGMTADYLDEGNAVRMGPDRVAPVASWLMSPACPLSGQTLVAGAGAVRPAARIEGAGLIFSAAPTPDELSAQAAALMELNGWKTFSDGNAAFDQLMETIPPKASTN